MTSTPVPHTPGISRRGFLKATIAAGVVLVAQASPVTAHAAAGDVTLSATGISVLASVGGRIAIRDASGVIRTQGSRFQVKDRLTGIHVSTGGTPTLVTDATGAPAIRMDYTFDTAAGSTTVVGMITVSTSHAHLEWEVQGAATLVPDGFLFSRAILNPTTPDDFVAVTEWVRDDRGGIPFEQTAGIAHVSSWGALHGMFLLERSRQAWTNTTWVHAPGTALPGGGYLSETDFFFSETRPSATATIGRGDELGIELRTGQAFNIWQGGQTASLTALVANGGDAAKNVELSWWVRDFNGAQLAASTVIVPVAAGGTAEHTFSLVIPAQGIALAEVTASAGTDAAFARTTLAALPPRTLDPSAASMFGMANYPWLLRPSATAVLDLWQRVGVSRVRISYAGGPGLPPADFDARGMLHNIELQPALEVTDTVAAEWATANVATAIAAGADYFEVGNELNRPFNTGLAAQSYIDKALRPVVDRVAATGSTIKIMNNGLAGMDKPWVENFIAGGGWDLIDAFAYHPGRGNFTPDYVPDGDDWEESSNGTYWNFYGGLKQLKALMDVHGEKEIWLTEAYACTRPNGWWNDTYRHAAENVFLTLALAKAEGIRNVCWYQFHDSVLGNPQVADPMNGEYHYGLMNRDLSAKPSLLAYANAATTLDGATFLGWLDFGDAHSKGMLFDTPHGQAAVLWSRADGYLLNTDHDPADWHFAAPEVWVDPWPTKTHLSLPASGGTVFQRDSIGQQSTLTISGGMVDVVIDGAPRVFYGLDVSACISGTAAGS
ncbi:hypothetical protein [Microbacterium sp. PMB16]|uniref:hypothetical protein n=1 Tax=Microbacterium sp. PMB16 TaxID=3120157 RepID=UPI003F4C9734